jgi:ornithine cyclodeaminase
MAREEGLIADDHIVAELGEVLLGNAPARTHSHEITLFKSLGLAIEDVGAAQVVYQRARTMSGVPRVHLGGQRL